MTTEDKKMWDEIKSTVKLPAGYEERCQLEDKYADVLPFSSGSLSYAPNAISVMIERLEENARDWEHTSTLNDTGKLAPDVCIEHAQRSREAADYLKVK